MGRVGGKTKGRVNDRAIRGKETEVPGAYEKEEDREKLRF